MDKSGCEWRPDKGGCDANDQLNSHTLVMIKLPDSWALLIVWRSLFLVMFLMALPSLFSMMRPSSSADVSLHNSDAADTADGFKILRILLRDLVDEGLIKKGHKGFILAHESAQIEEDFEFLRDAGVDLLAGADPNNQKHAFDFVFATSFHGIQLVDGVLSEGGLFISPLGRDPSNGLRLLSSYKIVYLRRFENTVVAMRKTGPTTKSAAEEALCGATSDEKRAALKGLEDVYLEPPRRAMLEKKINKKSSFFMSRKIKFLPDLLKDALDEYPRRVFVSDDSSALDWFYGNYPMRDQEFEVEVRKDGLLDWVRKNVGREDYVVMKAEAQVVEEMLKDETLCLVDELFMECKNQWDNNGGEDEEESGASRAYWQCLALYGKVRDEGIAVHQWWN